MHRARLMGRCDRWAAPGLLAWMVLGLPLPSTSFCPSPLAVTRLSAGASRCRFPMELSMSGETGQEDSSRGGNSGLGTRNRRLFLASAASAVAASTLPLPAAAAGNSVAEVLDVLGYGPAIPKDPIASFIEGYLGLSTKERRPKPVKLLRGYVYRPFAVLMMRSCYNTADLLDFVPMDQFQKDFFELRSDEWEVYLKETDARQGDLSDPKYFDFISAAQLATITREMRTGRLIFEELTGAEGTKEVVSRGPSSPQNNDLLPWALYNRAGETIYAGMLANFTGEDSLVKPPQPVDGGSTEGVKQGLTQLYAFLDDKGYAMSTQVVDAGPLSVQAYSAESARLKRWQALVGAKIPELRGEGFKISVTLKSPCILWGRQWLMLQGYMSNDHDVMIAREFLARSGRAVTITTTSVTENSITREYNVL